MISMSRALAAVAISGTMLAGTVTGASAERAYRTFNHGHAYGYHRYYRRGYAGNPAVGAAVAGAALGVVGLAAGAAAYGNDSYYGRGYYAPDPAYDPYGYGGY